MRFLISIAVLVSTADAADFTTAITGSIALGTDSAGDTYVAGNQYASAQLPIGTLSVGFVTKLDATGNIVFTKTFGGQCCTYVNAITVDPAGGLWIVGGTSSPNFPLLNSLQTTKSQDEYLGINNGFLVKIAPDGTLLYSSFFGGVQGYTNVYGITTDQNGNVYVTGVTDSSDFPTTPGLPASPVSANTVFGAFVTKLDATGQKIIYSARIAGSTLGCAPGDFCIDLPPTTEGIGVAVDGLGNALVAGTTNTTDVPVPTGSAAGGGAFALKINAAGNEVVYLTFLGAGASFVNYDNVSAPLLLPAMSSAPIGADAAGNAYVAGFTTSSDFPATPGAYQTTSGEGFAMKLNPTGVTVWATFLGGSSFSIVSAVTLDSSNNLWLTGSNEAGFPTTSPGLVSAAAGDFVAKLSSDGTALLYSAVFGLGYAGQDIAIDPSGVVHVAGQLGVSTITPGDSFAPRVLGIQNVTGANGSTGVITPGEIISIYGWGLGPSIPGAITPINGVFPTSAGGVQVLVNGTAIPLLYISPSQINAEIPAPLNGVEMGTALVQVINNSVALPGFRVEMSSSVFSLFSNADGSIAAINQNGSPNTSTNPAKPGDIVSVWGTGYNIPGTVDGAVATAASNYCSTCQVSVNNIAEGVQYAGSAPGLIDGVMQINFMIPMQVSIGPNSQVLVDIFGFEAFVWVSQ